MRESFESLEIRQGFRLGFTYRLGMIIADFVGGLFAICGLLSVAAVIYLIFRS